MGRGLVLVVVIRTAFDACFFDWFICAVCFSGITDMVGVVVDPVVTDRGGCVTRVDLSGCAVRRLDFVRVVRDVAFTFALGD